MRTCRSCNVEKPLMDFYQQTNGNLTTKCKECTCRDVRANRLVRIDQYREYERGRDEPNESDMRAGLRRLLDAAIAASGERGEVSDG